MLPAAIDRWIIFYIYIALFKTLYSDAGGNLPQPLTMCSTHLGDRRAPFCARTLATHQLSRTEQFSIAFPFLSMLSYCMLSRATLECNDDITALRRWAVPINKNIFFKKKDKTKLSFTKRGDRGEIRNDISCHNFRVSLSCSLVE